MSQNIREFNFDTDIEATLARIKELLLVKGKEYRSLALLSAGLMKTKFNN